MAGSDDRSPDRTECPALLGTLGGVRTARLCQGSVAELRHMGLSASSPPSLAVGLGPGSPVPPQGC